jgi:hypothetical protein
VVQINQLGEGQGDDPRALMHRSFNQVTLRKAGESVAKGASGDPKTRR